MAKRRQDRTQKHQEEQIRPVKGRVPPHDLDAEAAVLAASMLENDALLRVVDLLAPEHFYSDANRRIFEATVALATDGTPVDITTVASWLRSREWINQIGGPSYLVQLVDATPSVANVMAHAEIVFDRWRIRQSIGLCQRTAAEGYSATSAQDLIEEHSKGLHAIATMSAGEPMQALSVGLMDGLQRDWNAVQSGIGLMGRRTGLDVLDNKITGMHEGELIVVAARPGMGKTSLALGIGINVAFSRSSEAQLFHAPTVYGVPVFSLEMPREQLQQRLVCTEGGIDLRRYRAGQLDADEWRRVFDTAAALGSLPIWLDDTPAINVSQIRAKLRQLQASWCRPARKKSDGTTDPEQKFGAIIIDYLQLMSEHGEGDSREEIVASITRELKTLAKEFKVPVIALSQLNRSVETRQKDKRPQLSDLRESGAIEQDADAILFIYRDEYYNPGNTSARGIAEIIVAKQRNGPTGKVLVRFDAHCTRFSNLGASEAQGYSSGDDGE